MNEKTDIARPDPDQPRSNAVQKPRTLPHTIDSLHEELDILGKLFDELEAKCSPVLRMEAADAYNNGEPESPSESALQKAVIVVKHRIKHLQHRMRQLHGSLDL